MLLKIYARGKLFAQHRAKPQAFAPLFYIKNFSSYRQYLAFYFHDVFLVSFLCTYFAISVRYGYCNIWKTALYRVLYLLSYCLSSLQMLFNDDILLSLSNNTHHCIHWRIERCMEVQDQLINKQNEKGGIWLCPHSGQTTLWTSGGGDPEP